MRQKTLGKFLRIGLFAILALGPSRAYADFSLGAASGYAVLGVTGSSTTGTGSVMIGNVGIGSGGTLTLNGSIVDGNVQFNDSVTTKNFTQNGALITGTVSGGVAQVKSAVYDAGSLATLAASEATNANILGSGSVKTINANGVAGGNTVVSVASLSLTNATLNINGNASSYFIINIASTLSLANSSINLLGGVTADHVLFNVYKGGTVSISSGTYAGTFLAMDSDVFFSGGILDGQILGGGAGRVSLTGTVTVDDVSASPAASSTAPEPASLVLLGIGGIGTAGIFGWKRWRRRRADGLRDPQPAA